jgi:predicted GNAT superfamily acetyltransferase
VRIETEGGALDLTVRSLRTQGDYEQCEELERTTWGESYVVPSSLVMVVQKIGGVAAGAFDAEGRLVGTVFGLTGWHDEQRVHWSHMAAVRADLRGRGLGRELKLFQRQVVRDQGISTMLWSYDPLVARNAQLNINRLGALPVEYIEDLYGPGSDSKLHRGLGTDRFVVSWPLEETPASAIEDSSAWSAVPSANTDAMGAPLVGDFEVPDSELARVEIPVDVQRAKEEAEDAGARWRFCTRRAFQEYFSRGHQVVGFERYAAEGRCAYLLRQEETE